jgi:uncharacterized protein YigE (DUF2233 family)
MQMMRTTPRPALRLRQIALALGLLAPLPALAECQNATHLDQSFTLCEVRADDDLRLFLRPNDDAPVFGNFRAIDDALSRDGKKLAFAMNGGMYHPDRRPVGLYIEAGREYAPIVTREGPGNFGLLPNGVFCIQPDRFTLVESRAFAASPLRCDYAMQSGPMLVIDGAYHPRFLAGSDSRLIRNGVGVSADGARAVFVIANTPVSLYEFARFFREYLELTQALYIDGSVSRLHAPGLRRSDWGTLLGPIVGKVVDAGSPAQ